MSSHLKADDVGSLHSVQRQRLLRQTPETESPSQEGPMRCPYGVLLKKASGRCTACHRDPFILVEGTSWTIKEWPAYVAFAIRKAPDRV
jgi:hypothetical protein